MLKLNYFLADIFILSAEKQPIKLSWRKIECLRDYFKYNPSDTTSQRIQEALFEEKQEIIENCLFGVDLNPKSVEICRLRLWIELLKNAYYYRNEGNHSIFRLDTHVP